MMKKSKIHYLYLIPLAIIVMTAVIACGNDMGEQDDEYYHRDMIEDYVFIAQNGVIDLDIGAAQWISGLIAHGEFFYYIFVETFHELHEPGDGEPYFTNEQYIHIRGIDRLGNIEESITIEVSEHHYINIVGFNIGASGEFAIIIQAHNRERTESVLYYERYNLAGELLYRTKLLEIGRNRFVGGDAQFNENGYIAITEFSFPNIFSVHIWDHTLAHISSNPLASGVFAFGADGIIICRAEQLHAIQIIDTATGEILEEHEMLTEGSIISGIYPADETSRFDYYILTTQITTHHLYGFFLDTGETEHIMDFIESNLLLSLPGDVVTTGTEDTIIVAQSWRDWGRDIGGVELSILTPVYRAAMEEIERIVLAGFRFSPHTVDEVMAYNRRNPFQQIIIRDYFDWGNDVGLRQAIERFHFDIIAGETPDIVRFGVSFYCQELRDALIIQGYLSDLYHFIDLDPKISRDDFFPNILRGLEDFGGGLPTIGNRIVMITMIATDNVVTREYWTPDKFLEVMENTASLRNAELFGAGVTGAGFALTMVELMSYEFIDHYTGRSYFDSELFIRLLELAATIPENPDYANWMWYQDPDLRRMASDGEFIDLVEFMWLSGWMAGEAEYGMPEDFSFEFEYIGLPGAAGGIHRAYVSRTYGIFENSQSKDTAWQFIREILLPGATETSDIPLRIDDFETRLTASSISGDKEEALWALMNSASVHWVIHGSLQAIIEEGIRDFINGRHTAEEAARIIQSRVQIFLSERHR